MLATPCANAQRSTKSETMVGLSQLRNTVDLTAANNSGAVSSSSSKIDFSMGLGEWAKVRKVLWYKGSCSRTAGVPRRAFSVSHWIDRRQAFSRDVASMRMASLVTSGSSDQVT